jgi:hypothetical protein
MDAPITRFPFIDAVHAAELLGVDRADILEWIRQGRLASYGGKEQNPFVRTTDIERLATELGYTLASEQPKRRGTQDPVKRVQLRITADARWANVAPEDIDHWVRSLDESARNAARQVAKTAIARLEYVLRLLSESS